MNPELIADIRNKLQAVTTALELISQGKDVPKKDLDEAVGLLERIEE